MKKEKKKKKEKEEEEENRSICGVLQQPNVGYFYSMINFLSRLVDRQQVAR
jgi:hypothetical protein